MNWKLFGTVLLLASLSGCASHQSLCKYPPPPPELMKSPPPQNHFQDSLDRTLAIGSGTTPVEPTN